MLSEYLSGIATCLRQTLRIRIVGHQGEPYMDTGQSGPWYEFVEVLKMKGCKILDTQYGDEVDLLIANSHSKKALKEAKKSKLPGSKTHLVLWEPPVIDYRRHSPKILKLYNLVWSPSIHWAKSAKTHYFRWPQLQLKYQDIKFSDWLQKENKAVMVLSNKFSATKGELYTLRRKLGLITSSNSTMDLYGDKWNLGKMYCFRHYLGNLIRTPIKLISFKSWFYLGTYQNGYKGLSLDKGQTCKRYRFVVVIENSRSYISEKFFDAYASGSIVIYVGPKLSEFGIPDECAIQVDGDAMQINKKIIELMKLNPEDQFNLLKQQQIKILSISKDWYCITVLKKLAEDIYFEAIKSDKKV